MADNDSTLQGLPTLSTPAKLDLIFVADQSDAYAPKKLTLEALCNMALGSAAGFDATGPYFTLTNTMSAGNRKITNLRGGTGIKDAVAYGQIQHLLQELEDVEVTTPTVRESGPHIEVSVPLLTEPWGGFYLYYWCVDDSPSTIIDFEGESLAASSGATLHKDSSVENIVKIGKEAGMQGKYFHVVARYRNMGSMSGISPTATEAIQDGIYEDVFSGAVPSAPSGLSVVAGDNRVSVNAVPVAGTPPGTSYIAEFFFTNNEDYSITGTEDNLIKLYSATPQFTYDISLMQSKYLHVYARVAAVSLSGIRSYTETAHSKYEFNNSIVNEDFLSVIAERMIERLQTQGGEPLTLKTAK